MHINMLEDIVIVLSDSEDDSVSYRKAQKMAKQIKRKRQEKKTYYTDESDTSEESQSKKRAPHFRKQNKGNTPHYYSLDIRNQKIKETDNKNGNDIEMNNQYNE